MLPDHNHFQVRRRFATPFLGFDVARVAAMTPGDVERLVHDPSIIRNRAKIQATVDNARAMESASPSLAALAKSYASDRKRAPRSLADLPSSTPQAEAFSRYLKSQEYPRFVGPTCVCVHAERGRGQRPHPRLLPGRRLANLAATPRHL